jgi:hypothetical protein
MKLKHLKRDRTLLLTSMLLILMLGAGFFSGIVGFTLGHTALKGVTQPDIRPTNKSINQQNLKNRGLEVLPEQQLIVGAKEIMGVAKDGEDDKPDQFTIDDKPTVVLPLESKDQGIVLTVKSAKPEGKSIRLDITLKNQGSQAAKFGQDVLTVNDEEGKSIAANFTGLPQSLAANGKDVSLQVLVPKDALTKSKTITLLLTDVDRKLQIEAANIPVTPPTPKPSPQIKLSIPDGQLSTTVDDENDQKKKQKQTAPSPKPKPSVKSTKSIPKPNPDNRNNN